MQPKALLSYCKQRENYHRLQVNLELKEVCKVFYMCTRGQIAQHTAIQRIRKALHNGTKAEATRLELANIIKED